MMSLTLQKAEELGLDSVWLANIFSYDAISMMALIGRETNSIHLGTAVTPTYPRHPVAMAQQALTTAAASDNRFTLGIGLSHKLVIEDMFGLSYSKPIRHMKEYLGVLMPLLRGESANFDGQNIMCVGAVQRSRGKGGSSCDRGFGPADVEVSCRHGGRYQYVDGRS